MDDKGKLAIQRGPIIFCLEGHDQPDQHVLNKYIPENSTFQVEFDKNLLNGVVVLKGKAREVLEAGKEKETDFTAIPYSTWNNRAANEMAVWIPFV